MYLQFLSISIVFILLIDVLFYFGIRPYLRKLNPTLKITANTIYWGFTVFSVGLLMVAVYHYYIQEPPSKFARVYLSGFSFIVLVSKISGVIFFFMNGTKNMIQTGVKRIKNEVIEKKSATMSRKEFLRKTGVVAAALPFISLNYGMLFGAFQFKVRKTSLQLANLPQSFNGLKILQLSDIHSGSFVSKSPMIRAVELVNELEPDLVLFTGDLVNDIAEEAEPFIDVLKEIKASLGIYAVLGNHDYGDYYYRKDDIEGKRHNRQKMQEIYDKLGWKLLNNEHVILERNSERIGLIGSENWGDADRFPKYGDMEIARAGMPTCPVNILMSHDPSHWEREILPNHRDIDLTLSGHTHGFQMGVEIPGIKWSPAQYLYKQWAGLYQNGKNYIYVNRGLGFIGYPGRLGIRPEIALIELNQ